MKNDTISRSWILAAFKRVLNIAWERRAMSRSGTDEIQKMLEIVQTAPAVDAEPVRHGEWGHIKGGYCISYKCSECDCGLMFTPAGYNFCPNCGAKMDGGGGK